MLIRSVTVCTLRIVMVFCVSLGGDTVHVPPKGVTVLVYKVVRILMSLCL